MLAPTLAPRRPHALASALALALAVAPAPGAALASAAAFALALAVLGAGCGARAGSPARGTERDAPVDRIVVGGEIVTLEAATPRVEALAIRGERIVALGTRAEIERRRGPRTEVIDLGGGVAVPGLIDAHMHFSRLGKQARTLYLDRAGSAEEVIDEVARQASRTAPGAWITGSGWHTVAWPGAAYPAAGALERATAAHPVYLAGMANHAAWVNRRALALAGVTRDTRDPPGGRIVRDPATGEPTGVLLEDAKDLVARHLPRDDRARRKRDVAAGVRAALALGLTEVHDAGASAEDVAIYRELLAEGALALRLHVMLDVADPGASLDRALAAPPILAEGGRLTVRTLKVYADGALGARGAVLLAPYADAAGERGMWVNDEAALVRILERAHAAGWQVAVHAIGDAANRAVLDAVARVRAAAGRAGRGAGPRTRIEHAQVLAAADLPRFAALDVIASMQPIHATMDMGFAPARLGPERLRGAYAWRSLLAAGAHVAAGADTPAFPVAFADPLRGLHAAITREDERGRPAGGWLPAERVTPAQALAMYTLHAAYAVHGEADKGTLSPGKLADLTVLDRDPLAVPPAELLAARVTMTIVGGAVVHRRAD